MFKIASVALIKYYLRSVGYLIRALRGLERKYASMVAKMP